MMTQAITKLRRQPGTDAEIRLRNLVNKIALSVDKLSALGHEAKIFAQDIHAGYLDKATVKDRLREAAQVYALDIDHADKVDAVIDAALNGEATSKAPISNAAHKARPMIEPPAPEPPPVEAKAPEKTTQEGAWDHEAPPATEREPKARGRVIPIIPFEQIKLTTEPQYLVKGLIPRHGLIVVWGPPKCGKSFWTFDVVMHVALAWMYRGRRVQGGAVLYGAFEGAHGFRTRVEAFRQRSLADHAEPVPFFLEPLTLNLVAEHQQLIAAIKAALRETVPAAVVLDTLNRSIQGVRKLR
jgi:hypothetical protein